MIILYNKKNGEKKSQKVRKRPSLDHIRTYRFCLAYLSADMKCNGLHSTSHLIDVAIQSLSAPQVDLPESIEEEEEFESIR